MLRRCLTIVLVLSCFAAVFAQNTVRPNADSVKASEFYDQGKYDSTLYFLRRWESKTQSVNALANVETSIANVFQILGNNEECEEYLQKMMARIDRVSEPGRLRSKVHEIRGRTFDYNIRDFTKARDEYLLAMHFAEESGEPASVIAVIHFLIGRTYLFTGHFAEAESRFNKSLAILDGGDVRAAGDLFEVYNALATLNRRMLRMDQALAFYKKAERVWLDGGKSKMHPNYGLLLYGMGNLFLETGAYDDAIEYYSNALTVFRNTYGEKNMRTAATYMNIGAAKGNQLDFYGAIQYYTRAMDSYREILDPDHPFISSAYIDFCDSYEKMGRYNEALESGRKAVEILERRYGEDGNRELGIALYNTAGVLLNMHRENEALPLIERAITIFRGNDERYLSNIALTIKGQILQSLGRYAEAEEYFNHAADVFEESTDNNLHLAQTYTSHASLKSRTARYEQALDLCNRALKQLGIVPKNRFDVFPVSTLFTIDFISSVLVVRADALWNLYRKTGDQGVLRAALENYGLLAETYERIVMESKAERSKLLQAERVASACEKAIACALEMFKLTREEKFKLRAFDFSERSRAIIFSQFVHDSRAREFAGIPRDVVAMERRMRERISFREKQLADLAEGEDTDDSVRTQLHAELISSRMRYDSMLNALKRNYPSYHALKYESSRPGIQDVQNSLGRREGMVEYMLGDSAIYAFIIAKDLFEIVPIDNVVEVKKQLGEMRVSLSGRQSGNSYDQSASLYRNIFSFADSLFQEKKIDRVVIVPDGALSYTPFECLVSDLVDSRPAYLLQRYSFRYGFSAGTIADHRSENVGRKGSAIGFAPLFGGANVNLDEKRNTHSALPHASDEVNYLSRIYGGKAMIGDEATESNFRRMASDYRIIHLATHAIADDEEPDESRLYFATASDTLHDGQLYAYELLNMTLASQLVTLSACNTGSGSLHRGEGVMSLSRAFAFAGCPSIVTSLWQAQDLSTARIMEHFYSNLSKGMKKSDALRQAKLTYLAESDKVASLPFYWANLVVIGSDDAIEVGPATDHLYVSIAVGLLVLVTIVVYVKRRARLTGTRSSGT